MMKTCCYMAAYSERRDGHLSGQGVNNSTFFSIKFSPVRIFPLFVAFQLLLLFFTCGDLLAQQAQTGYLRGSLFGQGPLQPGTD